MLTTFVGMKIERGEVFDKAFSMYFVLGSMGRSGCLAGAGGAPSVGKVLFLPPQLLMVV